MPAARRTCLSVFSSVSLSCLANSALGQDQKIFTFPPSGTSFSVSETQQIDNAAFQFSNTGDAVRLGTFFENFQIPRFYGEIVQSPGQPAVDSSALTTSFGTLDGAEATDQTKNFYLYQGSTLEIKSDSLTGQVVYFPNTKASFVQDIMIGYVNDGTPDGPQFYDQPLTSFFRNFTSPSFANLSDDRFEVAVPASSGKLDVRFDELETIFHQRGKNTGIALGTSGLASGDFLTGNGEPVPPFGILEIDAEITVEHNYIEYAKPVVWLNLRAPTVSREIVPVVDYFIGENDALIDVGILGNSSRHRIKLDSSGEPFFGRLCRDQPKTLRSSHKMYKKYTSVLESQFA